MANRDKPKMPAPKTAPLNEVKLQLTNEKKTRPGQAPSVSYEPTKVSSRSSDFVYVNTAYAGSLSSVSDARLPEPPTSVIREQYCVCSRWPFAQKALAMAVGVLVGAVIGLAITVALKNANPDGDHVFDFFRSARPSPD